MGVACGARFRPPLLRRQRVLIRPVEKPQLSKFHVQGRPQSAVPPARSDGHAPYLTMSVQYSMSSSITQAELCHVDYYSKCGARPSFLPSAYSPGTSGVLGGVRPDYGQLPPVTRS